MKNEADLEAPKSWTAFDWDSEISVILLRYMTKCFQLSLGFQISSWPRKKKKAANPRYLSVEKSPVLHTKQLFALTLMDKQIRVYN